MSANAATFRALRDAPHTSVSATKTYVRCPALYQHRYLLKTDPSHRSVPLVLGRAFHEALEQFYIYHAERHDDPPLDLLLDSFTTSWRRGVVGDPPIRGDDIDADRETGVNLLRVFYEEAPRPAEVLAVEQPFALPIVDPQTSETDERLLVGSIDAIVVDEDGRITILEHKTAKRAWGQVELAYDTQPSIYQLAARELGLTKAPGIEYQFLMKLKKPRLEVVEVHRTREQEEEALEAIRQVLRAVDNEIFFRVRSWACADCQYGYCCS